MAIDLQKGNQVTLVKQNGEPLTQVCIGLNWGQIKKKAFFGLLSRGATEVYLDCAASLFGTEKELIETVCYKQLCSADRAVRHSGDDRKGDAGREDEADNEIITIDFSKRNNKTQSIVVFLNSFEGQDFAAIPYSKIRIYEGTPERMGSVFAAFNVSSEALFEGQVSMVMGRFYHAGGNWKFEAIGEPFEAQKMSAVVEMIRKNFA